MTRAAIAVLKQEAQLWMLPWPIDWTKYHRPVVQYCSNGHGNMSTCMGGGDCSVVWKPKSKKHGEIILTDVWVADDGRILQAGQNFGALVT